MNLASCIRDFVLAAEAAASLPRAVPRDLDTALAQVPESRITPASRAAALDAAAKNLPFDRERLLAHCAACEGLKSAAFFGSILRDDFLDTSDVDLLLEGDTWINKDWAVGFEPIFGRNVDTMDVRIWQMGRNPVRYALIKNSKRTFYER